MPFVVIALGVAAIGTIVFLQHRSADSRDAQSDLAGLQIDLSRLQSAPFRATAATGGSPAFAARLMRDGKRSIGATLAELRGQSPPPELWQIAVPLRTDYAMLDRVYALGASGRGYGAEADALSATAAGASERATTLLDAAAMEYHRRAERTQTQATVGSVAAILVLLGAFWFLYRRSTRARSMALALVHENERLLAASRKEALTDALTGLPNRRAMVADLDSQLERADGPSFALAMFDLDGFKHYNDTFGHPAGDTLLTRLARRLRASVNGGVSAYRMGGDEFCVVAWSDEDEIEAIAARAASALSEGGDVFEIGCSYGIALVPGEASTGTAALGLADQRMYEHKSGRSSASRQSADVLLSVVGERELELREHLGGVAELAEQTAERMGVAEPELRRIALAAELHDIGKTAIPDAILGKAGPLDAEERAFMRQHPLIGERILRSAPALAYAAELVRSSHERLDGTGYPDGLRGEEIPLGSSIISVCDAFDAMTSGRPYRARVSVVAALHDLRDGAGTQFLPEAVTALSWVATHGPRVPA